MHTYNIYTLLLEVIKQSHHPSSKPDLYLLRVKQLGSPFADQIFETGKSVLIFTGIFNHLLNVFPCIIIIVLRPFEEIYFMHHVFLSSNVPISLVDCGTPFNYKTLTLCTYLVVFSISDLKINQFVLICFCFCHSICRYLSVNRFTG